MSETRSREPLERDKAGARILTHGGNGYKRGCGCGVCTQGHADAEATRRAARSSRTPAAARRAAAQPGRRGGVQDREKREVGVAARLSKEEAAAFRKHVRALGDSESGFIRDLILGAIGWEDTARRPARRRANYPKTSSKTEGAQS
jgi:hypothetical protein